MTVQYVKRGGAVMTTATCPHHWVIEEPGKGKTHLHAECKLCPAVKSFPVRPIEDAAPSGFQQLHAAKRAAKSSRS